MVGPISNSPNDRLRLIASMLCLKALLFHVYFNCVQVSYYLFLIGLFCFIFLLYFVLSVFFGVPFPSLAYLVSTDPTASNLFCSSVFSDILINGRHTLKEPMEHE